MPTVKLPGSAGSVPCTGPDDPATLASSLIHCVRLPAGAQPTQPVPAVIMVHGWGGDESVMWIFSQTFPQGVVAIAPRAPIAVDNGGYAWFQRDEGELQPTPEELMAGIAHLRRFLTALPELYPLDPARLVLMGFSQGAAVCNGLALSEPDLVLGVASLAGWAPDVLGVTPQAGRLANLPVFIAHGNQDETVPVSAARQARETYTRLGAQVTYGEYPTGHKMTVQGNKDLTAWLAQIIASPAW